MERDRKTCIALYQKVREAEHALHQANIRRGAANDEHEEPAGANEMPTEAEAGESYQETLYDQACLIRKSMADETRRKLFAHIAKESDPVSLALALVEMMDAQQVERLIAAAEEHRANLGRKRA